MKINKGNSKKLEEKLSLYSSPIPFKIEGIMNIIYDNIIEHIIRVYDKIFHRRERYLEKIK